MGIWYYKARVYDPELGRFLQTDPIDVRGGINLYAYVGNDSVNFADPLGLQDAPDVTVYGSRMARSLLGGIGGSVFGGLQSGIDPSSRFDDILDQLREDFCADCIVVTGERKTQLAFGGGPPIGHNNPPPPAWLRALSRVGVWLNYVFLGGSTAKIPLEYYLENPEALEGLNPDQLMQLLKGLPEGWKVSPLGKGDHKGLGWKISRFTSSGHPTGAQIRWHPGGGHHGPNPYWAVNAGHNTVRVPAGSW